MQNYSIDPFRLTRTPANIGMLEFETNFNCLLSNFSGTSAPQDRVAFMMWYDTDNYVMKVSSHDNLEWLGLFHGDEDQKIWMFKNDVIDGWEIDVASDLTDCVCGIKGGETYTIGGSVQGEWTEVGLNHSHKWFWIEDYNINMTAPWFHGSFDIEGNREYVDHNKKISNNGDKPYIKIISTTPRHTVIIDGALGELEGDYYYYVYFYTSLAGITDSLWRPKAAVGTIQFLSFAFSPAGDYIDFNTECYDDDTSLDENLIKMEENCEALKSCRCADNHTPTPVTGEVWGDYLNKILRFYDSSEWLGLMHADESCITWIYRNDTLDGWVQHTQSDLDDCVIAVKGGSTYTTGGTIQGDNWEGGGINTEHNHQLNSYTASPDTFKVYNISNELDDTTRVLMTGFFGDSGSGFRATNSAEGLTTVYTENWGEGSGWRPRAAIGTLQYLDLTN